MVAVPILHYIINVSWQFRNQFCTMKDDKKSAIAYFKFKGIDARPISEKTPGKTPDLKLYSGDSLFGYCEIKSIVDYEFIGGGRSDPTYNKIQNKIHVAAKQFSCHNPNHVVPNILMFINHFKNAGFIDLWPVLNGQVTPPNKPSEPIFIRYPKRLAQKNDFEHIDYFIWIDVEKRLASYSINGMSSFQKALKEKFSSKAYEYLNAIAF